jgi:hypothetical protein
MAQCNQGVKGMIFEITKKYKLEANNLEEVENIVKIWDTTPLEAKDISYRIESNKESTDWSE